MKVSKMQLRLQTLQGAYFKGKTQIGLSLTEHIFIYSFLTAWSLRLKWYFS